MSARDPLVETRPTGHGRSRGLVSSRRSGRRVEAHTYAPPKDLRDIVECLWVGRWDLRGQEPHVTELLGDPCVHVVIERGASRVVGLWTRRWVRKLEGSGLVRAVKVRAGAARVLTRGAVSALTDRLVPLAEVFDVDVATLENDVLMPDDHREGLAPLIALLRTHRSRAPLADALRMSALVKTIAEDPSLTTVEALAARRGFSVRSLQRLFREHVGASPKSVLRRYRLQEVALQIERGAAPNLARLAATLGYTDQAHLARDFKQAVGKTPREFERSLRA